MSASQQNLLNKRRQYLRWIADVDRVIHEIVVSGSSSASLSSGGGSKSYTRLDLAELRAQRAEWSREVKACERALFGGSTPAGIRHVKIVRR